MGTRICDQLGGFDNLANSTLLNQVWEGYLEFRRAVEKAAPEDLSLRDKDRFLWGKSFCERLERDVADAFPRKTYDDDN